MANEAEFHWWGQLPNRAPAQRTSQNVFFNPPVDMGEILEAQNDFPNTQMQCFAPPVSVTNAEFLYQHVCENFLVFVYVEPE